jgi:4-hydroxy-2-oxoheptanedioate aldolase
MRVNKAIELLEQRQPVYFEFVEAAAAGEYDEGRALAQTWADYIAYDMEHSPFDVRGLMEFMRGLADAGPTRSGHRTPAVIVTLPMDGTDEHAVRANGWMIKQVLATGVHGLLLCHAETRSGTRLREAARYLHLQRRRGSGPDAADTAVSARGGGLGIPVDEYFARADPGR